MDLLINEEELKSIITKYLEDQGHKIESITSGLIYNTSTNPQEPNQQFQSLDNPSPAYLMSLGGGAMRPKTIGLMAKITS